MTDINLANKNFNPKVKMDCYKFTKSKNSSLLSKFPFVTHLFFTFKLKFQFCNIPFYFTIYEG